MVPNIVLPATPKPVAENLEGSPLNVLGFDRNGKGGDLNLVALLLVPDPFVDTLRGKR